MFAAIALLLFALNSAVAQLPAARLLTISPLGAKVGSTIEIFVIGQDLDELKQLRFSHPGITAAHVESNLFMVTVGSDIPPGTYDVRAVGKYGASNPRVFSVGVLKEITKEKNNRNTPQKVELGTTINGRTDANAIDFYRFSAHAGQRVLVRCEARELDSKLEPVLALDDATVTNSRAIARAVCSTIQCPRTASSRCDCTT
jgi:hypothetical protein